MADEQITTEQWRDIPGFPHYAVSDHGRIMRKRGHRSRSDKIMRCYTTRGGHLRVCLCENGATKNVIVHRAMALAFLGSPPSSTHVAAHNDGNSRNNTLSNIRWATSLENAHDRYRHGTHMEGERLPQSKLTDDIVRYIRASPHNGAALARELNVTQTTISYVRKRHIWKHVD